MQWKFGKWRINHLILDPRVLRKGIKIDTIYRMTYSKNTQASRKICNAITVSSENVTLDWHWWSAVFPYDFSVTLFLHREQIWSQWWQLIDIKAEHKNTEERVVPDKSESTALRHPPRVYGLHVRRKPEWIRFADFEGVVFERIVQMVLQHLLPWQPHFNK